MYNNLVSAEQPTLKYILTYKMSQDNLELFICAMRSSLGCNNNPTARGFTPSYKKMLVGHEIQGIGGNCAAKDQTSILHVSSGSTKARATTADAHNEVDMLLMRKCDLSLRSPSTQDHDYSDVPNIMVLSEFKSSAITYIAGYVVRMTRKSLSCGDCAAALMTGPVMASRFLEKKNRGGLVRPAPGVVKVCETTEKCFQSC